MLGLALMPDADLTVPEGGVAAWTHEFACLYSRSACSCQTLAQAAPYHFPDAAIRAPNQE